MNDAIYMQVWVMSNNTYELHPSSPFYNEIPELHYVKISANDLGKKMLEVSIFINNQLYHACLFECV